MSRSSARRAQVEPVPALVAVLAVCLALGAYASVRAGALPRSSGNAPTDAVLADATDAATPSGSVVVLPSKLSAADVAPDGYDVAVHVQADNQTWTKGATDPPPSAASASQRVPVRVAAGRVVPGRLTVEVWQ